jgi:threonine/homoserine/homoserine lactone efflux protein
MLIDLFLIGLVVTLEPIPITAMILLLAAERGIIKGVGYVLGWLVTLVAIVAVTVLVTDGKPLIPHSSPSEASLVIKLFLGVVLVFVGYRRNNRRRGNGQDAGTDGQAPQKKQPRWMSGIDRIGPFSAAGLAFLLQPWVMVAAGVSTITQAKINNAAEWLALFAFCLLCSATLLAMEIYAVLRPETVKLRLAALLEWINTHTDQAIVILSLGLGLYLMAKSIYELVGS